MELSFDGAAISAGKENNYLEVGNHKVKVTKVEKGLSTQKQSPYVAITVTDESGKNCTQNYYLNGGAWNISKSAILTIIAAAGNCDEATAKSKLTGVTTDNIDSKLSSLLLMKQFAITLNGEWVNPSDASKSSWVKSTFGSYLFAVPTADFDKLSKKPYIKGDNMGSTKTTASSGAIAEEKSAWS